MNIRARLTILFSLLALVPLVAVSSLTYVNEREALIKKTAEQLISLADVQVKRVDAQLERYLEQAKLLTSRTQLRISLATYLETRDEAELARVTKIISDGKSSVSIIRSISILDLNGEVVASTATENVGVNYGAEDFYEIGRKAHTLTEIFVDDNNILQAEVVGPLILEGELIGVTRLIMTAAPILDVTQDRTGLGETGEIMLARSNEVGDAVFLTPLRFDSGAALSRAVSMERSDVPIIHALAGEEAVFTQKGVVDYRNVEIFAVTRYIDSLDWGLVVKIDRVEALAPVNNIFLVNLSMVTLSALLTVVISLMVTRSFASPIIALTGFADRLKAGKFEGSILVTSNDEIGVLTQTFNTMSQRLSDIYSTLEQKVKDRTREVETALIQVKKQNEEVTRQRTATLNVLEDLDDEREKLEVAKARDEAILSSMGDGLIVTDTERRVLLTNGAAATLTGLSEKGIVGHVWPDVLGDHGHGEAILSTDGGKVPMGARPIMIALQQGKRVVTSEYKYVRSDATEFPVAITASPLTSQDKIVGAVIVFRDISKEKEIDKAKSEFVSLASHQLRTPLSTINWYAEMLSAGDAGKLTPEQAKYVSEIYTGNQRMVDLVNALLDVSRLELGTFSVEPAPTNIVEVAQSVIKELEPMVFKKKIGLEEDYGTDVPIMNVDPKLIRIVFQNLLSNAVKYTPEEGKVNLSVLVEESELVISVVDTGYGIPKDQQDKIFGKLFRADNVREKDTTGTGLGLYLVKSIVDHSGGSVEFTSEEDKGTTFVVRLPIGGMKAKKGSKHLGQ